MAILVQKLGAEKMAKSVSGSFMAKKSSMAIKPGGGGGVKALMARPSWENFFLRLHSYSTKEAKVDKGVHLFF